MANVSKLKLLNSPKALKEIERLISLGMTEHAIALKLGVSNTIFIKHKKENIVIQDAIARGHSKTISEVVGALLKSALGYYKTDTKLIEIKDKETGEWVEFKRESTKKWFKGSDKTLIFYLLNKDPNNWTNHEKQVVDIIIESNDKMPIAQLKEKLALLRNQNK